MIAAAGIVLGVLFGAAFLLFLGGIASAAREIRAERAAGVPVTRPGWRRSDRTPHPNAQYRLPKGTGWVVWPLVALGLPHVAERYLVRRGGRVVTR